MEKIKNLPVLRLVAFAVALAILLGVFLVMLSFTASAESTNDISTSTDYDKDIAVGTLKNYSCLKLSYSSEIDYLRLRNLYNQAGSPYMIYSLFGVDSSGKLVHLTSNYGEVYRHNDYTGYQYASIPDSYYVGKSYKFKLGFSVSPADSSMMVFNMFRANYDSDSFNLYGTYASIDKSLYSNFYLLYTGLPDKDSATFNSFITDVSSNISSSDFKGSSDSTSPSAKFVTCASFTNDDGSFPLWCKSFVAEGQQYPLFTYFIKDNGNKHKYSLVLSYNNNDVAGALCTAFYDKLTNDMWRTSLKVPSLKYVSTHIFPMHDSGDMIRKAALRYFESGWKNATFSQSFNLNGSDMDFSNSTDSGNKVYTLCLSDYSAIVAGQIYKVEIWDNTISEILDTTYFVSRDSFGKSNSGTGVKIYDYKDDGDRMEQDIINNTPSVTPGTGSDFKTTGDIEWSQFNDDLTNVDITSIFSSLHSAINSVGVFFQACWAIIPSSIFAILLSGLSLIIVLRVLGR